MNAEVNAPFSSSPSMAMFTMPDRSHMMPAQAPKTSGVEKVTAEASMPMNENSRPAAAHARNDMNMRVSAIASTTFVHLPNPRHSCTPASTASVPEANDASGNSRQAERASGVEVERGRAGMAGEEQAGDAGQDQVGDAEGARATLLLEGHRLAHHLGGGQYSGHEPHPRNARPGPMPSCFTRQSMRVSVGAAMKSTMQGPQHEHDVERHVGLELHLVDRPP